MDRGQVIGGNGGDGGRANGGDAINLAEGNIQVINDSLIKAGDAGNFDNVGYGDGDPHGFGGGGGNAIKVGKGIITIDTSTVKGGMGGYDDGALDRNKKGGEAISLHEGVVNINNSKVIGGDGNFGNASVGGNAINIESLGEVNITNGIVIGGVGGNADNYVHGGKGGDAIKLFAGNLFINGGTIIGGYGGTGSYEKEIDIDTFFHGNPGIGGNAINMQEGNIIINDGRIVGGNTGFSPDTYYIYEGIQGGDSVYLKKGSMTINKGIIIGGDGGVGFNPMYEIYSGNGGKGGTAIKLDEGLIIINEGVIIGGLGGEGRITTNYSSLKNIHGGNGGEGGTAIQIRNNSHIVLAGKASLIHGFGGTGGPINIFSKSPDATPGNIGKNGVAITILGTDNVFELQRIIRAYHPSVELQKVINLIQNFGVMDQFDQTSRNPLSSKELDILIPAFNKASNTSNLSITDLITLGYLIQKEDYDKKYLFVSIKGKEQIQSAVLEPLLAEAGQISGIIGNVVMKAEDNSVPFDELKASAKTNILVLGGDDSLTGLSFDLGLIGEVVPADTLEAVDAKPLRAFGLMEKRGTSTWQVTGTLDPNIIERFDVKEGVLELIPDAKVNSNMGVINSGILTTPAIHLDNVSHTPIVSQLTVSDQGVFQVIANNVNEYSRLHSTGDITLAKGSQLFVHAPNYQGEIGEILKYVLVAEGTLNTQFSRFSDDNPLYDFVPNYNEANVMHLNVVLDKALMENGEPLLSGTANRSLMEASDLMHRYLPADRCGMQGDNHAWVNLLGSWSTQQSDGKRSGYDANHQGIAMGSDRCLTENVKLGIYASAVHSKADSRGIADKHQMKANSWQVGLYGNAITSAKTDIEAYIGVGKAEIDGKRYTQLNQKLAKSDYNADMISAGMGVNYHLSDAITPFLRLDYTRINADSYHETGAELMNLTVKGQTSEALIARAGVKFDKAVTDKLSLYAKASVGVDLLHREQAITAAFSVLPTNTFSVKNGKFGRVIGDIELGTTYHFTPNVSLQFGGQATGREGSHSLGVQANFTVRF